METMLGGISVKELHGPLTDLLDKLQGKNGEEWFAALKRFLRREDPWTKLTTIWTRVQLGDGYDDSVGYRHALALCGYRITEDANLLLNRVNFNRSRLDVEVDLVRITIAELGLRSMSEYQEICSRALKLGLELCPPDLGPALRLQYGSQTSKDPIFVAMEPILNDKNQPKIFAVTRDSNAAWLAVTDSSKTFDPDNWFVFAKSRD